MNETLKQSIIEQRVENDILQLEHQRQIENMNSQVSAETGKNKKLREKNEELYHQIKKLESQVSGERKKLAIQAVGFIATISLTVVNLILIIILMVLVIDYL